MKVLVTGGAGFVGSSLVKRLIDLGHEVTSVDNYHTGRSENHHVNCTYIKGEISNLKDFPLCDLVFHLAAVARIGPSFDDPMLYFQGNICGTMRLVDWCAKNKVPLVYAGSSSKHHGRYANPYTFSKDVGEDFIKLYQIHFGLEATIARFYNVYGEGQLTEGGYTTLIGRWIHRIENGRNCVIYGDGEQRRDFTHVLDIVDALVLIMERKAFGHEFELGRGKNFSVNEVAKMFRITPRYEPGKPGEARITLNTDTNAGEVLNWKPKRNLPDYIQRFLDARK